MALPVSFRIAIHPCILFIAQNWIYAGEARENLNDYSLLAYQEYRFSFLNFNLRIFFLNQLFHLPALGLLTSYCISWCFCFLTYRVENNGVHLVGSL